MYGGQHKTEIFYIVPPIQSFFFQPILFSLNKLKNNKKLKYVVTLCDVVHFRMQRKLPICFYRIFFKCLKHPSDSFNVFNHVTLHSGSTRSSSNCKLEIKFQRTSTNDINILIAYLYYGIHSHLDLSLSFTSIKRSLNQQLWDPFIAHFDSDNSCTFCCLCPCSRCHSHFINVSLPSHT